MIHTLQHQHDLSTTLHSNTVATFTNRVLYGDCIDVMQTMPAASVDLIVTDPPYLARYRSRDGRSIRNDDNDRWLDPAFARAFRVLRPHRVCVSFYGWPAADRFLRAWRGAGFYPIAHLVFAKSYVSRTRFVRYQHELAYVLAKGRPEPRETIGDVLSWEYTGNRLHPSQKPVSLLKQLIRAFSSPGDLVLDPFCGSGSSLVAARELGRGYIGIELTDEYWRVSCDRLQRSSAA